MNYSYKIKNLNFQYPTRSEYALSKIDLCIQQGEFVVFFGSSGCGKSTLLKQLKTILTPHGNQQGEIYFEGCLLSEVDERTQSGKIGYVTQSPDNQIVTDKVWHEMAFGLESLGMNSEEIRLRVAEMASFFGIQTWFHKNVSELSGGQKQILNLASIMVMQPSVLILDEPTSQLDPIASGDFFEMLKKINEELGVTILLSEQRLEDALPIADRAILIERGRILLDEDEVHHLAYQMKKLDHPMFDALPTAARIHAQVENVPYSPMTVKEGKAWLADYAKDHPLMPISLPETLPSTMTVVELDGVWFRYEQELPDTVKGLNVKIAEGELFAIVGGNGSGKTTTLSLMSGLLTPYRGRVNIRGKDLQNMSSKERYDRLIGLLPQNPQHLFVKESVEKDLYDALQHRKLSTQEKEHLFQDIVHLCELEDLLPYHPYDLSGGEQQRAALAKVLLLEPTILFLDEPTKGLDGHFKRKLAGILKELQRRKITIIMVSHDVEFCASHASRCAMFFDGNIVSENEPRRFFSGNRYYTTATNRMARDFEPFAVVEEDLIFACNTRDSNKSQKKEVDEHKTAVENVQKHSISAEESEMTKNGQNTVESIRQTEDSTDLQERSSIVARSKKEDGFSKGEKGSDGKNRMVVAAVCFVLMIATYFVGKNFTSTKRYFVHAIMLLELIGLFSALFPSGKLDLPNYLIQEDRQKRQFTKRTLVAMGIILILIPLTLFVGIFYLNDRKYYFISMLIIVETLVPFALLFESRKPQAKELVVIAVLCAIAVAGRIVFSPFPQFKPVAAIVIIAGACLGAESGFLTGALTMFLSNMMAGQGPWTPWQMFSMGIIGFLAGLLYKKGWLSKTRGSLCVYGAFAALVIYGGLMNPASVLMFQARPTMAMIWVSYAQGFVFDLVHAMATVFFLWFTSKTMIEKIERVKVKYGLLQ